MAALDDGSTSLQLGGEHTEHALQEHTNESLIVNGDEAVESEAMMVDEDAERVLREKGAAAHRPMQGQEHGAVDEQGVVAPPAAQRETSITPGVVEERDGNSSPRFSYTNNHLSDKAHLRGAGLLRHELLEKVLSGEVLGETLVRMDLHAGKSRSGEWRRFDELLRDSEAVVSHLGMTLGQLCAAGYGRGADTNEDRLRRQRPAQVQFDSASPSDADQSGRRRAMSSIASSLTRQLFAKNFARSDLVSSPLRSAQGKCATAETDQDDGVAAEPGGSTGPSTPSSTDTAAAVITAHTPSIPFLQESNVPSASVEATRGVTRLPAAVSGPRIEAFRELSGAGGRKLGYIASAVSSQLAAVGSAAAASATSATIPAPTKGQSAARAALINASTGLDYSPTSRSDMYVRSGGF